MEWTTGKVQRFWDFASGYPPWESNYFTKQVGAGLVRFARLLMPLKGRALDYGCGPGYLSEQLLKAGVSCEAVDFSPESVKLVNEKFGGNSLWLGAHLASGGVLPFPDGTFDLIFCIETIEHVLPDQMETMLSELRRVLKPHQGTLLITTNNSEVLESNFVCCPECGSVFHRVQHVSSFTAGTLQQLMNNHGFITKLCGVTKFERFQQRLVFQPLDWTPRQFAHFALRAIESFFLGMARRKIPLGRCASMPFKAGGPNLFWAGSRQ